MPEYTEGMMTGGMNLRRNGNGMMRGGMGERMTDLGLLRNATPFDKEFIEQMVPHHQMAIMMAQMTLNSDRKEMRDLGRSIIESQSSEVARMREWYYTWYQTPLEDFSMTGMNRRV